MALYLCWVSVHSAASSGAPTRFTLETVHVPGAADRPTPISINDRADLLFNMPVQASPEMRGSYAYQLLPAVRSDGVVRVLAEARVHRLEGGQVAHFTEGFQVHTQLNSRGQLAGYDTIRKQFAVRDRDGKRHPLNPPRGAYVTDVIDINDAGHVLSADGIPDSAFEYDSLVIWNRRRVRSFNLGSRVAPLAMNNRDEVLLSIGRRRGVWTAEAGLQVISASDPLDEIASADSINDRGEVVGTLVRARATPRAYVWNASGVFRTISAPPGGSRMVPTAINNRGDVLGYTKYTPNGGYVPWFSPAGSNAAYDVASMISTRASIANFGVVSLNNVGQLFGTATVNGKERMMVLTPAFESMPVPEPIACVGVGGLLALLVRPTARQVNRRRCGKIRRTGDFKTPLREQRGWVP